MAVETLADAAIVVRADFTKAKQDAARGGQEVGAAAGRGMGDAFVKGSDGKLRDANGRLVSSGRKSGSQSAAAFGGSFSSSLKSFAGHAAGIMGTLTASVTGVGLAGLISFGIKSAASLEQAQVGFETMLGSAKSASAFLTKLQQFAAATPFELPGLIEASRTLLGVGVAAKDVVPTLKAYGDAAGALGIQQDSFQRIMVAVSQSMSAGKIKLGDMNQLMNNGLPIWKLMSEAMHKPVPALQAMISHGKLLSKDVLPLLQKQMEKDYGGSMAKQSQTLAGVWSTLKDTVAIGLANAIKPLVPMMENFLPKAANAASKALTGISGTIVAVVGAFKSGKANSSGFTGALERVGVFIRNAVPVIHNLAVEVGTFLVGAFRVVGPAVASVAGWFNHHRAVAVALVGTIGALVAITRIHGAVLAVQAAGGLAKYIGQVGIVQKVTKAWAAVQWVMDAALNASPIALVVVALVALAGGLYYAWTHSAKFRDVLIGAWNGIKAGVSAVLGWFTGTVWPVLQGIWHSIAGGALWLYHNAILPAWHGIQSAVSAASSVIAGVINVIVATFKGIARVATWLYTTIFAPIFHAIGRIVQAAFAVAELAAKIFYVFVIGPLVNAVKMFYNNVIKPTFNSVAGAVRSAMNTVVHALTTARDFVVGGLTRAFHNFSTFVGNVWGTISGAISRAITTIKGWLTSFGHAFTVGLVSALQTFSNATGIHWSAVKKKISDVWNAVKGTFNTLINFITKTIPNAFKAGVDAIGAFWKKLGDVAKVPITFTVKHIINPLIGGFNHVAGVFGTSKIPPIAGFAEGGRIDGAPSSVDNRWAWLRDKAGNVLGKAGLATGEFVVNARDTARALPLLNWVNQGMQGGPRTVERYLGRPVADMPGDGSEGYAFAKGGLVGFLSDVWGAISDPKQLIERPIKAALKAIPGLGVVKDLLVGMGTKLMGGLEHFLSGTSGGAATGSVGAAQAYLRAQDGKPYSWASAGPFGFDCSGIVDAVYNIIKGKRGRAVNNHVFSTESARNYFPMQGFGGPLVAAWSHPGQAPASNSVGHMMGMVGGLTFESTGSRGVHLGATTRRPTDFANIGHFNKGGLAAAGRAANSDFLSQITSADTGRVTLRPGWNMVKNGTGAAEPLSIGGGAIHVHFHNSVIARDQAAEDMIVKAVQSARKKRRIP